MAGPGACLSCSQVLSHALLVMGLPLAPPKPLDIEASSFPVSALHPVSSSPYCVSTHSCIAFLATPWTFAVTFALAKRGPRLGKVEPHTQGWAAVGAVQGSNLRGLVYREPGQAFCPCPWLVREEGADIHVQRPGQMGHLQKELDKARAPPQQRHSLWGLAPCLGTPGGRGPAVCLPTPLSPRTHACESRLWGLHGGLGAGRLGPSGVYP